MDNGIISVVWDDQETMKEIHASKGCGCKGAKCDGSTTGCRNCFKMCKPCVHKCKCRGNCNNPHNNGGTCLKCRVQHETDGSDVTDDEELPDTLPLVTRSTDMIDTDTEESDDETDNNV